MGKVRTEREFKRNEEALTRWINRILRKKENTKSRRIKEIKGMRRKLTRNTRTMKGEYSEEKLRTERGFRRKEDSW